jgi:hypothetical protein
LRATGRTPTSFATIPAEGAAMPRLVSRLMIYGAVWLYGLLAFQCISAQARPQAQCEYAGQTFSVGATICECPSLKGDGGRGSGGEAKITSRRMVCSVDRRWTSADSLCLDLEYPRSAAIAVEDLPKYHNLYCPRLPINHTEIEKAISQETDKFFTSASKSQAVVAVQAICRRFGGLAPACKAMIEALSTAGN